MPRKKAFSTKQKKQQLKQKRQKKRYKDGELSIAPQKKPSTEYDSPSTSYSDSEEEPVMKTTLQPLVNPQPVQHDPNRFHLHFDKESREEVEKRKELSKTTLLIPVDESALEVSVEDIYQPGSVLDIPKRPAWSYSMTKDEVETQEEVMFAKYLEDIHSSYEQDKLSYFEHNLETWRQLWRVLELSDVILLITDIRHPILHFSPALYTHVVEELKKQLILVLNKVDLVPPQVAVAWRHYFLNQFPQLDVVCFTCYPNSEVSLQPSTKVRMRFRRRVGKIVSAVGPKELFNVIEKLYRGKSDVTDLHMQVKHEHVLDSPELVTGEISLKKYQTSKVLTIGLVGHPNVGKSSILNGIMEKKYVSTSRTPGHTKHLQTIFLTPSVRLCDCPGLVFPSLIDKQLQVLSGICPVAQVREPYTSIGYLAERVPLINLLHLSHPQQERDESSLSSRGTTSIQPLDWTAWDVCDAWAEKKRYYTSRVARLDTYKAANHLLRLASDGRICLFFRPPGYSLTKDVWEKHDEVLEMILLQQRGLSSDETILLTSESDSEEEEEGTTREEDSMRLDCSNKFAALLDIGEDSD